MNRIRSDILEITQTDIPLTERLTEIENFQLRQGVLIERAYRHLESGNSELLGPLESQLTALSGQIMLAVSMGKKVAFGAMNSARTDSTNRQFKKIHDHFVALETGQDIFNRLLLSTFSLIKVGRAPNIHTLFKKIEDQEERLIQQQEQMIKKVEYISEETAHRAEQEENQGITLLGSIYLASIIITLFLSLRLAKGVMQPLAQASEIADLISENKLDITIPPAQVLEINKLFTALQHMIKAIQERKRLEHLLMISDKMSSIGQLAAGIAHEINNPLASATMGLQTLKTLHLEHSNKSVTKKIVSIEKNLDRASTIARELLTFARENNTAHLPVNLQDEVDGALTLLGHKLNHLTIHQEWGDLPDITGDYVKIEQVFINIFSNAADAMPDGGEIGIVGYRSEDYIFVQISDNGQGIDKTILPMVFDPFFTTKEVGRGTGLGLSICYNTIADHKGMIEIASEVGKGTKVTIKFPINQH